MAAVCYRRPKAEPASATIPLLRVPMSSQKFGGVGHMMAIVGDLNVEVNSVAPCKSASVLTAEDADGDAVCTSCREAVWCL